MQMRDAYTMPEQPADRSQMGYAGPKGAAALRRGETA